jgi:hypothetical protein
MEESRSGPWRQRANKANFLESGRLRKPKFNADAAAAILAVVCGSCGRSVLLL